MQLNHTKAIPSCESIDSDIVSETEKSSYGASQLVTYESLKKQLHKCKKLALFSPDLFNDVIIISCDVAEWMELSGNFYGSNAMYIIIS